MWHEPFLVFVLWAACAAYTLTGGADFGAGVLDLFAMGKTKDAQRQAIEKAIAPIWEANHIWMILVIVLLFSCFPRAFSAISIALHFPIALMLVGIVVRGTAFVFRSYDTRRQDVQRRWGVLFSIASLLTPVLLGVIAGSVASGAITLEAGEVSSGYFTPWTTSAFPWVCGAMVTSLFTLLAATYLLVDIEAADGALKAAFTRRALYALFATVALGGIALFLAKTDAPSIFDSLVTQPKGQLTLAVGALLIGALGATLSKGVHAPARWLAMLIAIVVLVGWGLAQYPYALPGTLTFSDAASEQASLVVSAWVLLIGGGPLLYALFVLFRIFKSEPTT